ncbi:MAG: NADP-dependent oxidoreductase [Burkholderiaceae bacterium]|nr:NADP-dependent oxidoreductase [Burkholderiaceae bacterium]MEB2351129.1 NADP-dependent oxidoreductase [Burkholderiaceae bacterium]
MSGNNLQILLASRPQGKVTLANFRLVEAPIPVVGPGEVLVRNHFLSLDPYMRGRMNDAKSYAAAQPLDEVMIGGTAGEVVESRNPAFAVGDRVMAMLGWQLYGKSDGRLIRKVDTSRVPLSAYLGAVGMPGVTAWYGLNRIVAPEPGQTVVVSAASGAVGSVVGQLARRNGCRVIGVAGGAQKCAIVVDEYGLDACIDYKAGQLYADLRAATPDGIDGYFDNVGGATLDAVLRRMNAFGRIAVCGLISTYDGQAMPLQNFGSVLVNRLRVEGFIVSEHMEVWPEALRELGALVATGELKYRETIAQGLESAPEAFIGLLAGRNVGKQLVRLIAP